MLRLPDAHVVSPTRLILLHTLLPTVDLYLLRSSPRSRTLRSCLIGYHALLPLLLTSNHPAIDLFLVPTPIYVCAQNMSLPAPLPPVKDIVLSLCSVMLEPNPPPDSTRIRQRGVLKMARGALKYGIKLLLVPLLSNEQDLLQLPFYSPLSIGNTLGYGAVLYCIVGSVTDVVTGLAQAIMNKDLMELMDNPYFAYSLKDFWSRRWNRIMANMFHRSVFAPTKQDQTVEQRRWKNSLSAMTTFAASGVFHEILVSSLFRETHGEHMAFFLLQGLATVAEVQCLGSHYAPKGIQHVLSTSSTFLWLGVTGRLFFLPFWRRTFFSL
ncbi:hypothetical protein K450DRAFT_246774 [Umbelopsis ramanniana AG]|uniref:Wax synthase domain-containing protein n=1 Tax=Umbelopsis ramanniana AG TaxID=1314678 RepID=A0AAD5E830_UMBRA|nr:uncharacterized protein K450DRAFT_246774 [Umbelopsis ramanniana AG]KAI8578434.1 hypothetical protein K450DRAFT_246774 [Umbelopsis ramanniana AG]